MWEDSLRVCLQKHLYEILHANHLRIKHVINRGGKVGALAF